MSDFILNKAGAKIYKDIKKHEYIETPVLSDPSESGIIYNVLSVGFVGVQRSPIMTVEETDGKVNAYRLPDELGGWMEKTMNQSAMGVNVFPSKVEFGKLNNRVYAEMILED
ncbi:hypothetical protein NDK25_21970 [Niallia taxi]|nr:hypothetical protein [Niallia taxi]MDE5054885.1 hypothetical protein [Niallia taxi]